MDSSAGQLDGAGGARPSASVVNVNDPHSHRAPEEALAPWHRRITEAFRLRYSSYGERGLVWRLLTPIIFVVAGALFVTSAISSAGTDLRPGRYDDLADLAVSRSDRVAELTRQSAKLQAEIDRLTAGLSSTELDQANAELEKARGPAGLVPVKGPGITVTLDDAPERVLDDGSGEIALKIVHQQDIQAVANAMWAGGAEAVTVQGQRIVSTTGIKCVGSSVLLQGIAYPPPYTISAIGNTQRMLNRIDRDPTIALYLRDVDAYQLGWDVQISDELSFPRYDGPIDTDYAQPIVPQDSGT